MQKDTTVAIWGKERGEKERRGEGATRRRGEGTAERQGEGTKERLGDGEIKRKGEKEKRIIRRGEDEKMRM